MIILLLGGELRHKEAQRWARVQPADAGGRDFHLQFTFQAPASDHRAPRPLDPGQARSRGRSPTSPPHPQAFPLALPPSTASSPAQRPSLQECTLVVALVGILRLYYFPAEVRQTFCARLTSSHSAQHPGQSPRPPESPRELGHVFLLVSASPRPDKASGSLSPELSRCHSSKGKKIREAVAGRSGFQRWRT